MTKDEQEALKEELRQMKMAYIALEEKNESMKRSLGKIKKVCVSCNIPLATAAIMVEELANRYKRRGR